MPAHPQNDFSHTATPTMPHRLEDLDGYVANDGVASLQDFDFGEGSAPKNWKKMRREAAADRRVSDAAMDWMATLPRELRLMHTMLGFPHVVNMLATTWSDPHALAIYFVNLLNSRRKGRAGFPAPVKAELSALHGWAQQQKLIR